MFTIKVALFVVVILWSYNHTEKRNLRNDKFAVGVFCDYSFIVAGVYYRSFGLYEKRYSFGLGNIFYAFKNEFAPWWHHLDERKRKSQSVKSVLVRLEWFQRICTTNKTTTV